MNIENKIKDLLENATKNGQYSIEDVSGIYLNKADWDAYSKHSEENGGDLYVPPVSIPIKLTNANGPSRCYFLHSRVTRRLGIIGTAGRNEDLYRLNKNVWDFMKKTTGKLIETSGCNHLISGGAAWADHLAVSIFLKNSEYMKLNLHLPCDFKGGRFEDSSKTGRVLNYHHKNFSNCLKINSLSQIESAINKGCSYTVSNDSFYERNSKIASESNLLIAFTFGDGKELKSGGTKDTFNKFLSKKNTGMGFHINLTDYKIYIY